MPVSHLESRVTWQGSHPMINDCAYVAVPLNVWGRFHLIYSNLLKCAVDRIRLPLFHKAEQTTNATWRRRWFMEWPGAPLTNMV